MKTESNLTDTASLTSRRKKYVLPDDENKAEYVKRNFNEIAAIYDKFNDISTFGMHRSWKRKTIQALSLKEGDGAQVLDLCCGSGDLTLILSKMPTKVKNITSLDFSSEMLRILQAKLDQAGKTPVPVELVEGDASKLTGIRANSMDAVVIGFGLRNVTERAACLKEIYRVLKPGKSLAVLDVGKVKNPLIGFFHKLFFNHVVPVIGHMLQKKKHEMYNYLPASAVSYPGQVQLKAELEEAGFRDVNYRNFLFGSAVRHIAVKP